MKLPTFVKQGLLGLFWQEESNNRALFAKLLQHCKLCTSFNILECLISEKFLLQSRVSHAYVTQRVLSHSDERTSSFTELCTFENHALWCTQHVNLRLVPKCAIVTLLIAYFLITSVWPPLRASWLFHYHFLRVVSLVPRHKIFRTHPEALSKNTIWTPSW